MDKELFGAFLLICEHLDFRSISRLTSTCRMLSEYRDRKMLVDIISKQFTPDECSTYKELKAKYELILAKRWIISSTEVERLDKSVLRRYKIDDMVVIDEPCPMDFSIRIGPIRVGKRHPRLEASLLKLKRGFGPSSCLTLYDDNIEYYIATIGGPCSYRGQIFTRQSVPSLKIKFGGQHACYIQKRVWIDNKLKSLFRLRSMTHHWYDQTFSIDVKSGRSKGTISWFTEETLEKCDSMMEFSLLFGNDGVYFSPSRCRCGGFESCYHTKYPVPFEEVSITDR